MSKQYGLIVPGSKKTLSAKIVKASVFGSESDSEDEAPSKAGLRGPGDSQKRQARIIQEKALEEDPTIFQYDEVYDDIDNKRKEEKQKSKSLEERKPKYIGKLLETAEKRKKEQERRIERQVQKEREAEGEMFRDKESFVTTSYRKKIEEMRLAEEEEKREEYLESIGDVTKQKDLDGFYRHLYEQKLGNSEIIKEQPKIDDKNLTPTAAPLIVEESRNSENIVTKSIAISEKSKIKRSYRKRKASVDDVDGITEEINSKKTHLQSNLDADSDFSIDSSSSEDEKDNEGTNNEQLISIKEEIQESPSIDYDKDNPIPNIKIDVKAEVINDSSKSGNADVEIIKNEKEIEVVVPPVPKIDIWKKRTVGDVFDAAVQRYYERKAMKQNTLSL